MILRMKVIRFLCRITCAPWIPFLRVYRSNIIWALVFELVLSIGIVLGVPGGYPLAYSIILLLGFALDTSFGTQEGYLIRFLLGTLSVLMIFTGEGYCFGLSLGIPLGSPPESTNPGDLIPNTMLGALLGLWFGYEAVRYWC